MRILFNMAVDTISRRLQKIFQHTCGTNGKQDNCVQGFLGDMRKRCHLEDLGVDGGIILKRIFNKYVGEAHELD